MFIIRDYIIKVKQFQPQLFGLGTICILLLGMLGTFDILSFLYSCYKFYITARKTPDVGDPPAKWKRGDTSDNGRCLLYWIPATWFSARLASVYLSPPPLPVFSFLPPMLITCPIQFSTGGVCCFML